MLLVSGDRLSVPPDFGPAEDQPAWRQDFPIDWPADHYVERRDFMKFMVLTSGAFTTGQFWIAAQQWRREHRLLPEVRIAGVIQHVDQDLYGGFVISDNATTGLAPVTPDSLPEPQRFTALRNLLYALE